MKKTLIIIGVILAIVLAYIFSFGIQIGNVRLGKQNDLKTEQIYDFKSSPFYKDYYSKKELTVLNLWATWCGPCVAEMPMLNEVKEEYKSEPIHFLSFSVDMDSVKLVQFLEKGTFEFKDITLENLSYRNTIINIAFGKNENARVTSYAIPRTIFVKNGKIMKTVSGSLEREEFVQLLNEYK